MSELVLREHSGAVATVTLNSPAALNAVYGEVFRQLLSHPAAIDAEASAKELILTGRLIDAHAAARMGLVNEVMPHAELDTAVAGVCAELTAVPAAAVAMAKQLLNTSFARDFEALLELVKLGNMHLTQTSDFKEAVAAWLQQSGPPRRE